MKKSFLFTLSFILLSPLLSFGQEDMFQVKTPNVMVIFDTSTSMNKNPSGTDVGASAVKVDSFGRIDPSGTSYLFEGGGNHPNSKLYQAKLALKQIIQDVVRDRVNLGFSTYGQSKTERRRGRYQRTTADRFWLEKYYWGYYKTRDNQSTTTSPATSTNFTDVWGGAHTGVAGSGSGTFAIFQRSTSMNVYQSGMTFPPHPSGPNFTIPANSMNYTVYQIDRDYENNRVTFRYRSDEYWWYRDTIFTIDGTTDCGPDTAGNKFPATQSSGGVTYRTYFAGQSEYNTPTGGRAAGFWSCRSRSSTGTTEYSWRQFNAATCPGTDGTWNKVLPEICYDFSDYSYPADGSINKPHVWSYFKISGGLWPESGQLPNYYPATYGSTSFINDPGLVNNHFFFQNVPDDKDPSFSGTIRTNIRNQIMSYLDLTPVKSPETNRYWTKLPLHNINGKRGITENITTSSFTPLADSLKYARKYFYDYIYNYNGGDPASQQIAGEGVRCRGNFIILLTDGLESARLSGGVPDYTAAPNEAQQLLNINVKTFVIGFGTELVGNQTLDNIAISGGTAHEDPPGSGVYRAYYATSLDELKSALNSIFQAILSTTYGRSNPVITRERSRLYRGYFEMTAEEDWKGYLTAWDLNQTGDLVYPFVWDAGVVMSTGGRGTIYTWTDDGLNPSRKEFRSSDPTLYPKVNPLGEDINGDGLVNDSDAQTIINFTLDPNYGGGIYKGKRSVAPVVWKMGDIYHSTPVVIGSPASSILDSNYLTFYNTYKNRQKMIYVGANDGMLHAFRDNDGSEAFAILPKNLLGKLKKLKATHEAYVDSSPKASDVFINGEWKTILITGEMKGGPYYFAVDVTNPDSSDYPKILWEWTDTNMGESWAKPDIGKVNIGGTTKFVAFITGGYSTEENKGNSFYILDIETGTILKSFTVGSSSNKVPPGPVAFDADRNGFIDYVYFGDTSGTLWKVDVRSDSTTDWTLISLFTPSDPTQRKPIFYSPTIAKNDEGKILIFFGTGDELTLMTSATSYFWEIWDDSGTGRVIGSNWPKQLIGQKILASPVVANFVAYFTSWLYSATGEFCGSGEGRLYGYKISTTGAPGGMAGLITLDASGNPDPVKEYISLGAGIPTAPIVTNETIYVFSSVNANQPKTPPPHFQGWSTRIRSWKEVF